MNPGKNYFRRAVRIDHPYPIRLALGELEEALSNPTVKLCRLVIEAAFA
jgi:hypothetical protein